MEVSNERILDRIVNEIFMMVMLFLWICSLKTVLQMLLGCVPGVFALKCSQTFFHKNVICKLPIHSKLVHFLLYTSCACSIAKVSVPSDCLIFRNCPETNLGIVLGDFQIIYPGN
jgi:hypothetical protein